MPAEKKLMCGVGINDADYKTSSYSVINGKSRRAWMCPIYSFWRGMIDRCYGKKPEACRPTYTGCSVTPEWLRFSVFRAWAITQDYQGKELDKDILAPGNKIYSPENCVFIPLQLNRFLNANEALRSGWPIGVHLDLQRKKGKFRAQCSNPFTGKNDHLGRFSTPEDAHEAWRKHKHSLACAYADMQSDHRIAEALRARFAKPSPAAMHRGNHHERPIHPNCPQ